eukprot:jgi/Botrbrau1/6488/Bobra.0034s0061.1
MGRSWIAAGLAAFLLISHAFAAQRTVTDAELKTEEAPRNSNAKYEAAGATESTWNNLASAVDMIASAVQANQAGPVLGSAAPAPGFAGAHSQGYAGAPAPGLGSMPFSLDFASTFFSQFASAPAPAGANVETAKKWSQIIESAIKAIQPAMPRIQQAFLAFGEAYQKATAEIPMNTAGMKELELEDLATPERLKELSETVADYETKRTGKKVEAPADYSNLRPLMFLYSPQMTIIARRIAKAFDLMNQQAMSPFGAPAGAPAAAPHGVSAPSQAHASAPAPTDGMQLMMPYAQQVLDSLQKELKAVYDSSSPGTAPASAPAGSSGVTPDAWRLLATNMAASVLPQIPRFQSIIQRFSNAWQEASSIPVTDADIKMPETKKTNATELEKIASQLAEQQSRETGTDVSVESILKTLQSGSAISLSPEYRKNLVQLSRAIEIMNKQDRAAAGAAGAAQAPIPGLSPELQSTMAEIRDYLQSPATGVRSLALARRIQAVMTMFGEAYNQASSAEDLAPSSQPTLGFAASAPSLENLSGSVGEVQAKRQADLAASGGLRTPEATATANRMSRAFDIMSQNMPRLRQIFAETEEAPAPSSAVPVSGAPGPAPVNVRSFVDMFQAFSNMASNMAALSGGQTATNPVGAAMSSVNAIQAVNQLLLAMSGVATSDPKQAEATLKAISAAREAAAGGSPAGAPAGAPGTAALFDTMSSFAQQMNTYTAGVAQSETSAAVNMFSQLAQMLNAAGSPAGAPTAADLQGVAKTLSELTTRLTADSMPTWARDNFIKANADSPTPAPAPKASP